MKFSDDFENCAEGDVIYRQGEEVENYRSCHSCYCNNATITCQKIKCSPPIEGCQPIIPEGHCCPVSYKCGNYKTYFTNTEMYRWSFGRFVDNHLLVFRYLHTRHLLNMMQSFIYSIRLTLNVHSIRNVTVILTILCRNTLLTPLFSW